MSDYFQNPEDLQAWVRSRGTYDAAAQELMEMINTEEDFSEIPDDEQDIVDTCQAIFEENRDNASEILFGVLAKHQITTLTKKASNHMEKQAQSESRQRNDWTWGARNKWNRSVDGFNDGTPWRVARDKYYDFTHYATDEIKFDEDPQHIYSGESIWRTYVMDKFYRDYKDEDGHVVGGYINDRFYVFPTAGTPANPDVPRDHGNQMSLADGERTRKPKPYEYSVERRLEEARGDKLESITIAAEVFNNVIRVSKNTDEDIYEDRMYNMFKDTLDMREAGIDYELMIESISDHYSASILGVAQVDRVAQKLLTKHAQYGYEANVAQVQKLSEIAGRTQGSNIEIVDNSGARAITGGETPTEILLDKGTTFVGVPDMPNVFEITDSPVNASLIGARIGFQDMNFEVGIQPDIQQGADELGLNDLDTPEPLDNAQGGVSDQTGYGTDFSVTEM